MSMFLTIQEILQVSSIYCAVCFFYHFVVLDNILPAIIPGYRSSSKDDKFQYCNRLTSASHAAFLFSRTAVYWLYVNPTMEIGETVSASEAWCIDIMCGYLWYDGIMELALVKATDKETLAHHVVGLISHLSTRLSNNGAASLTCMLVYIAEGSTPFLHFAWVFHKLNMKNSNIFKALGALLLLTFFVFRVVLSPYLIYHMLTNQSSWGADTEILFWFNFVVISFFGCINYYWFYKIVRIL